MFYTVVEKQNEELLELVKKQNELLQDILIKFDENKNNKEPIPNANCVGIRYYEFTGIDTIVNMSSHRCYCFYQTPSLGNYSIEKKHCLTGLSLKIAPIIIDTHNMQTVKQQDNVVIIKDKE